MLQFDGTWRFESPGNISRDVINDFAELIGKIPTDGDLRAKFEHFKAYFAPAAGATSGYSSNASWAESDLHSYMSRAPQNAPLFIEAFYDACEAFRARALPSPIWR